MLDKWPITSSGDIELGCFVAREQLIGTREMHAPQNILLEVVKLLPGIVTAVTAVIGVTIAARGLTKWRSETIGKRQAELAEESLADFYEARDIIEGARTLRVIDESTRKPDVGETLAQASALNGYFAVIEQLQSRTEFCSKVNAKRYRFVAHFGEAAAKPYDEIREVYRDMIRTATILMAMMKEAKVNDDVRSDISMFEERLWRMYNGKDATTIRLDAAVAEMERICRPIIQEDANKIVSARSI
jgi:hypothetical protein